MCTWCTWVLSNFGDRVKEKKESGRTEKVVRQVLAENCGLPHRCTTCLTPGPEIRLFRTTESCASGPRDYTTEATTRDAFALLRHTRNHSRMSTRRQPRPVPNRVKKLEPTVAMVASRPLFFHWLVYVCAPLILIGVANVANSTISDTVCTLWLR